MYHFLYSLVFGIYFDRGECLDIELGHDIVNRIWLVCHHACLSARLGVYLIYIGMTILLDNS